MPSRVRALLYLAWALVVTLARRAFTKRVDGLALFHLNYDADRLPAVSPDERRELASFGGCFACGRCDVGDAETMARTGGAFPGTMRWVLSATRSMPDADVAAAAVAGISDETWAAKEALCPSGVPMRRLVAFVRAKSRT